MPNPTLIAATKNNAAIAAAQTSATVTSTGSVTAGNLQVVAVLVSGAIAPTGITPPDGSWTTFLATTTTEASGLVSAAIFYKKAAASGAFSGSFSWTTASTGGEWLFMEWSGCGAGLVDGAATTNLNGSATNPTSPAITPGTGNVNDTLVGMIFGGALSASTVAVPGPMSSILTVNGTASQPLLGAASLNLAGSGAAGAETWTLGTAQAVLGVSLLLQQGPVWGFDGGGSGQANSSTPPAAIPPVKKRALAAAGRSQFASFSLAPMGWEVQPPQPPYPKTRRAAGTMWGDDGTEFTETKFVAHGWPVRPWQPPHPAPERRAAAVMRGDDGAAAPYSLWTAMGWEVQPPQPPHRRTERFGAMVTDDDGTEAAFRQFVPVGWEPALPLLFHPRPERAGSLMRGDDGNENGFSVWQPAGWEPVPQQPRHPRPERGGAVQVGDPGTQSVLINFRPAGWEVQPVQPNHPRPERAGAIMVGEAGTEAAFAGPASVAWGYEAPQQTWRVVLSRASAVAGRSQFASFQLFPWGGEATPALRRPPRNLSTVGSPGTDAQLAPPATAAVWGHEQTPFLRYRLNRVSATKGQAAFAIFAPYVPWWETPAPQPNHPRPERAGALAAGDPGTEAKFVPPPAFVAWGYEPLLVPSRRFVKQPAAWDDGIADLLRVFRPAGWEPNLPPQPRRRMEKAGAVARWEDGTELPFSPWFFAGWEVQPPQPPHRRPERAGAIMVGEGGVEAAFSFVQPFTSWAYDPTNQHGRRFARAPAAWDDGIALPFALWRSAGWEVQAPQPPHPRPEQRGGAVMVGDGGVSLPFALWRPAGWEVQPPQPPHPRPERAGAIMPWAPGIEAQFTFVSVPATWAHDPPPQPPHPRPERAGAVMAGDAGIQATFSVFYPAGREIQPPQPPRRRWERSAAVARGDDGDQHPFAFFVPHGWPVRPWQPPHPAPERRAAAVMRGDDGAAAPYSLWTAMGWEVQPWQPPHPRPERAGAVARGDDGVYANYFFQFRVFYALTQISAAAARTVVKGDPFASG